MRIVLMGNGPFAVPSFDRIASSSHEILGVVARPAAPRQGSGPPESPVVVWARARQLSVHTPISINDPETVHWLGTLHADLWVVCDYGQILKPDALAAARLGGINLHGSLLPRHRGAAPVQWTILAGDHAAGVSVIHMTPALDAGPILAMAATQVLVDEDAGQLEGRLSELGVAPTLRSIDGLDRAEPSVGIDQDRALATRAPRLKKGDGELHWDYPVAWIDRQIRGLQPWPGAFTHLELPDGKSLRLLVHRARPVAWQGELLLGNVGELLPENRLPLFEQRGSWPFLAVIARDGIMVLESVQPAGKRVMSGMEFLRGYSRQASLRFRVPDAPHPLLQRMMALPPETGRID